MIKQIMSKLINLTDETETLNDQDRCRDSKISLTRLKEALYHMKKWRKRIERKGEINALRK